MSLSSWLGFGKKKTSSEADSSSDADNYVVVPRVPQPADNMYPLIGPGGTAVTLPYHVQPVPTLPVPGELSGSTDVHPSNPLDNVPFKLSSLLVGASSEWSRNDAAHFKSVVSRAIHHNETVYKYDFSHEESIVRESNEGSEDRG